MNTGKPLVSVLMTAYNRERFISEAIESVLASTYTNFELIIVDDGSTDGTVSIARSYAAKDVRIKVYINEKNLGDYPNRNRAASYASGEYLMFVDSDDKIFPEGIERCEQAMSKFPDAAFGIRAFHEQSSDPYRLDSATALRTHFFQKPFLTIGPGGTIQRRIFFEGIGCYPEKYGPANDMYFNLKAGSKTNIVKIPFEYMYYRLHEGQEQNNKSAYLYHMYNYLNDALHELQLPLSFEERNWLLAKNKRRFVVNLFSYLRKTGSIGAVLTAIRKTDFSAKDLLASLYHKKLRKTNIEHASL